MRVASAQAAPAAERLVRAREVYGAIDLGSGTPGTGGQLLRSTAFFDGRGAARPVVVLAD